MSILLFDAEVIIQVIRSSIASDIIFQAANRKPIGKRRVAQLVHQALFCLVLSQCGTFVKRDWHMNEETFLQCFVVETVKAHPEP